MHHHLSQTLNGQLIPEISAQNYAAVYVILGAAS